MAVRDSFPQTDNGQMVTLTKQSFEVTRQHNLFKCYNLTEFWSMLYKGMYDSQRFTHDDEWKRRNVFIVLWYKYRWSISSLIFHISW